MRVLIGVDPHKGSHTAVAIDRDEVLLGQLKVRASRSQCVQLLEWAEGFPERRWAIESAGGLGSLLAQQLITAGEEVVDVPPTLSARVRVLGSGKSQKNDPNDALSTAVAALRHRRLHPVVADDHAVILRMLADRHHDLPRLRTQAVCRLHAMLANLALLTQRGFDPFQPGECRTRDDCRRLFLIGQGLARRSPAGRVCAVPNRRFRSPSEGCPS